MEILKCSKCGLAQDANIHQVTLVPGYHVFTSTPLMEINPYLLNRILEDQQKGWDLLTEWVAWAEGDDCDCGVAGDNICLKHKTEAYLKPLMAGLDKVEQKLSDAKKITVIKNGIQTS